MKLLKYILIVFVVSGTLLYSLYYFYRKGYDKYYSVQQSNLKEIFCSTTNYDILFIGSSRTLVQINPRLIDSITHLKSYNAGIDGSNLLEMEMVFKGYLEHHTPPKIVFVDLPTAAFDIERRPIFNLNMYLPFLSDSVVYNTLRPYEHVFLLRHLPFTQLTEADDYLKSDAFYGWIGKKEQLKGSFYKGYLENGNDTIAIPFKSAYDTSFYRIRESGINYLNEMISLCKSHGINMVITYAPEYYLIKRNLNPQFFETINKISSQNNIQFWNYRDQKICKDNRLFANPGHLNKKGADIYTILLANDINTRLGKQQAPISFKH
jgi:hypothetical protein